MLPSVQWLKDNFNNFNYKYFGGNLPMPEFGFDCPQDEWACYDAEAYYRGTKIVKVTGPGTIHFNKNYSRSEKSLQESLLHEMIHMYIFIVLHEKPLWDHGPKFMSIARKINKDGWNISSESEMTDDDVLVNGEETEDGVLDSNIEDNKAEDSNIENDSTESSETSDNESISDNEALFQELNDINNEIEKLNLILTDMEKQQGMNESKRLVISEEQEKKLIELLKESNYQVAQLPVDKEKSKPYCIDPEKVLIVKKHLDDNFKKFNYTNLKGGKKNTIKIVGMMDGDNVLKYMYTDDLKDYLVDTFQKMFLDKVEREMFLTKVMNAWLNNKIGIHGMLDVNYLN